MKIKNIHQNFINIFVRWLPLGFAITVIFFFVYVIAQQNLRSDANDPQTEGVKEVIAALDQGAPFEAFNSTHPVEISTSLSPYVLIFDAARKPAGGSGVLHGEIPTPPNGIFDYLLTHGEDRVTWQPEPGVRQAIIAEYHAGQNPAYIFVGRSLTEVEKRIDRLTSITAIAWGIAMLGSLSLFAFLS